MSGELDTMEKKLTETISTLVQSTHIVLRWIPEHTDIRGNERADQLTKDEKKKEQPPSHLSYRKVKTLIHNKKSGGYNPNYDTLHQMPRYQQTTIFRLKTGHCRLNSHLKRIGIKTCSMPLWRSRPSTRKLPAILLTLPPGKAANMAYLCVPQNQALWVCRGFVPDIQVCGTHGREDLVNTTITLNAEDEDNPVTSRSSSHRLIQKWTV